MSENVFTLSELFALQPAEPGGATDGWRDRLGARLDEELKGIQWPTALPDVAQRLAKLLDVPLPTLFVDAWKKMSVIQTALAESQARPEETRTVGLGRHTIECTYEPSLQVRLWKVMPLPKELKFPVKLEATFDMLALQIRNGAITRISGGDCEMAGTLSLANTPIAQKHLGTIRLDGMLFVAEETLAAPT